MNLQWRPFEDVSARWPKDGRHLLASYDDREVVVYQAFRGEIADAALAARRFAPPFRLDRMSWIKPGFLWMMHRSAWGTRSGQERILAIHLERRCFETILSLTIWSSFQPEIHGERETWRAGLRGSEVRLQWDPDHDPDGRPQARRVIQLGLRGSTLAEYASRWAYRIEDITALVREQAESRGKPDRLFVPLEQAYPLADEALRMRLGLSDPA
jgi:hypothetical protein